MTPDMRMDDEILSLCPDFRLGWLTYEAEPKESGDEIRAAFEPVLAVLRKQLEHTPLAEMPNLGESRKGYRACGKDPGRWRVSSEALYRRIRQGKDIYRINTVVDVNNLVSLETGFSLGSYDRDHLQGTVTLRRGLPGECYAGIGKGNVDLGYMPLLADAAGPVGSPSSDSTRAMVAFESRRILTVIYSFSARRHLEKALELACGRFSRLAGVSALCFGILEK